MNERINELIKQSYVTVQSPSGEGYTHFSQEKFAELIVRECMEQVFYTIEDEEQDNISGSIRDRITQHFGVEE
jgi:hypothetical protein